MAKKTITPSGASKFGPYSSAVKAGDFIFVSAQAGGTDTQGKVVTGIEAQTKACLEKMKNILAAADASMEDVVKTTVFIARAADFSKMNEVYQTFFKADAPARTTVVADTPKPEWLVLIDCVAYTGK